MVMARYQATVFLKFEGDTFIVFGVNGALYTLRLFGMLL